MEEMLPLKNKKILVTRTQEQAGDFSRLLKERGAEPVEFPVIAIEPPESFSDFDYAIKDVRNFDWIIFTSVNAVKAVEKRLKDTGKDFKVFRKSKICAVGVATAGYLEAEGASVDLVPEKFVAESVAEGLIGQGIDGKKILYPKAEKTRDVLKEKLLEAGAEVVEAVVYRTVPAKKIPRKVLNLIKNGEIDVITFTSSSCVVNFMNIIRNNKITIDSEHPVVACIGPVTAQTAEESGLKVSVQPEEHTVPGLVCALSDYYRNSV